MLIPMSSKHSMNYSLKKSAAELSTPIMVPPPFNMVLPDRSLSKGGILITAILSTEIISGELVSFSLFEDIFGMQRTFAKTYL